MSNLNLTEPLLNAAIMKCKSDVAEAKAKIALYLNSPVGVGDHPDIVQEILTAAELGSAAQERMQFLAKISPTAANFIVENK